jgi:hypothetical protein
LQKVGILPIEIHGNLREWQCAAPCSKGDGKENQKEKKKK